MKGRHVLCKNHVTFVLKKSDKAGVGASTDDSGTAGAAGQSAVSNCGSESSHNAMQLNVLQQIKVT